MDLYYYYGIGADEVGFCNDLGKKRVFTNLLEDGVEEEEDIEFIKIDLDLKKSSWFFIEEIDIVDLEINILSWLKDDDNNKIIPPRTDPDSSCYIVSSTEYCLMRTNKIKWIKL